MATTPVNSNKMTNPLLAPKAQENGKAKASDKIDPATLLGNGAGGGAAKSAAATGVQISKSAAERAKALDIAKNTPDIREDKVADLKARIASGKYEIDSGAIADGMMREAVIEHLAETTERSER